MEMQNEPIALPEDEMKARIFVNVAVPLIEEVVKSDPKIAAVVKNWNCVAQIHIIGREEPSVHIVFANGEAKAHLGKHSKPTIAMGFKSARHLVDTFNGAMFPPPKISGMWHVLLLLKFMNVLNSLQMLQPTFKPTTPEQKALKVSLLLYMVSGALEQMSAGNDEFVTRVAMGSKGKVAAWSVLPDGPNAYITLNEGAITAHRGISKKRPFATTEFINVDAAYEIMTGETDLVTAMSRKITSTKGSPEYAGKVAMLMKRVDYLMNPPVEAKK